MKKFKRLVSAMMSIFLLFINVSFSKATGEETHTEHCIEVIEAKEPTCNDAGNIACYRCSVCGKYFSDAQAKTELTEEDTVIPAMLHSLTEIVGTNATCTQEGNTSYWKCTECNRCFSDKACTTEINEKENIIPATGHSLIAVDETAATCTKTGNTAYYKCSDCDRCFSDAKGTTEIKAEETVIPATEHSLKKVAEIKTTCTSAGRKAYYKCSVCGKRYTDSDGITPTTVAEMKIPATGHKLTKITAIKATCTKAGRKAYYKCSVCGRRYTDAKGTKSTTVAERKIQATGHKLKKVAYKAPTIAKSGNKAYYKCSVCGKCFTDKNGTKATTVAKMKINQKIAGAVYKGKTSKGYEIAVAKGITYVGGIMIANKTYSLPSGYNPGGLTSKCTAAFKKMADAAAKEGISLYVLSGFRSYSTQQSLYSRYCYADGKSAADRYSARPGHSEHQTGLAIDVNSVSSSFANTREGRWLAKHCCEYGFILRYPKGKESKTGYMYEPWHIRYVGSANLATKITKSGLSLEEYLGIQSIYAK